MPKVRTQIYLTEEQHQILSDLSNREKTPVAEMIRQAVDEYLDKISTKEVSNPLNNIIALGKSGSSTGSVKHDEEIYGD
jgi:predicted DNA-binding protein